MDDDAQRAEIRSVLEGGLSTETTAPQDEAERRALLGRIRQAPGVEAKITAAGFALRPVVRDDIEQSCENCMYYLVRRRYCDLPEIALAVEPEWWCRLWRI